MNSIESNPIWFYISLCLAAVLIFQAGMWYGGASPDEETAHQPELAEAPTPTTNTPSAPNADAIEFVLLDGQYDGIARHPRKKALGNPDAPVTVTEYLDVECPFCQRLNRNSIPKLIEEYVKTGKVYYQIRHFPLGMHERAIPAGNALECGAEQGHFWPLKYASVQTQGLDYTTADLIALGEATGIPDHPAYESCVRSMKHENVVRQEKQAGSSRGVSATPTLFIKDKKIQGAGPYSAIKDAIEAALEEGTGEG